MSENRELSLDELDQVSGGAERRDTMDSASSKRCPTCGSGANSKSVVVNGRPMNVWVCDSCGFTFNKNGKKVDIRRAENPTLKGKMKV